ncbi:hypothetical protein B0A58_03995 [Flavobacterium branchiophilum NBRC 15030 = ATCC 35035]|uniref:Uncharacterized protein n=1 Tax=Flavobacterium branchiophilum TaxID=55197 RepID=A0A543G1F1_9FLAO|nr:hypothetical protein B0A58_03995 [Flavobacterium branchiophilum NBRC 15030 = ATCC 35035]TQM39854.1 hypothetical protein BC670_0698 [Flavobacterium branchiophilum]GEM55195.1 hypothetical protein FB1_14160 [Flavobacterium branchiophilum NBRC 15030 = ATCC 35035]
MNTIIEKYRKPLLLSIFCLSLIKLGVEIYELNNQAIDKNTGLYLPYSGLISSLMLCLFYVWELRKKTA